MIWVVITSNRNRHIKHDMNSEKREKEREREKMRFKSQIHYEANIFYSYDSDLTIISSNLNLIFLDFFQFLGFSILSIDRPLKIF